MKKTARTLFVVALTLAFGAGAAFAQRGQGMGPGMHRYDKTTETTIHGIVNEVQTQPGMMGGAGTGTHLLVATGSGVLDVHVGPTNWLKDRKYELAAGDHLQILGSKVKVDGADAFIAREIKKGDTTMVLRNENGIPMWSGAAR